MLKNINKVLIILLAIILIASIIPMSTLNATIVDPIQNPDSYKPGTNTEANNQKFIDMGNDILGAIRFIGTLISVLAITVLGIKYMLGSTQEKATYKETMIPYLIGAVMLFAIPTIVNVIYELVTGIKY